MDKDKGLSLSRLEKRVCEILNEDAKAELEAQEVKDEEWSAEFSEYTPPWRETKDG